MLPLKIIPQILCKFQFQIIFENQFHIQNGIDPSEHMDHHCNTDL